MVKGWKPPRLERPSCNERSVFSRSCHNSALLRCVLTKMLGKYKGEYLTIFKIFKKGNKRKEKKNGVFFKAFRYESFLGLVFEQRGHFMMDVGRTRQQICTLEEKNCGSRSYKLQGMTLTRQTVVCVWIAERSRSLIKLCNVL